MGAQMVKEVLLKPMIWQETEQQLQPFYASYRKEGLKTLLLIQWI
jgi:hypothetical protein